MRKRITLIGSILALLVGTIAYAAPPEPDAPFSPGEVLVKLKDSFFEQKPEDQAAFFERHGVSVRGDLGDPSSKHLKFDKSRDMKQMIEGLESDKDVEYAEPNYSMSGNVVPYDPYYSSLWGMKKIKAPEAWDIIKGNKNYVLGTIDSGIFQAHPDLKNNIWNGIGYNALTRSNANPLDNNGHGSHVAGTIGATGNNGYGVTGVNWDTQIAACKFLDQKNVGTLVDAIACVNWFKGQIVAGVPVIAINNSWSGPAYSKFLYDAIKETPALFVCAAGNNSSNGDVKPVYPASYNLPNILSVAATDQNDNLASFSNYGKSVHVGAPGVAVYSTLNLPNKFSSMSGTSMAAPHVTGIAGLVKAANPDYSWKQIRNVLLSTGDSVAALKDKTFTGKRVNAYKAVTCQDSRFFDVGNEAKDFTEAFASQRSVTVSVVSINCAEAMGPVTLKLVDGTVYQLHDDGRDSDLAADDGVFTFSFIPPRADDILVFSSPAGEETIIIGNPVVDGTPVIELLNGGWLPDAQRSKPYRVALALTGGMAPYTWKATGLPAGVAINNQGVISGTPTAHYYYPCKVAITVTDAAGRVTTGTMSMRVFGPTLTFIGTTNGGFAIPAAKVGQPFSYQLKVGGGEAPYRWNILWSIGGMSFNNVIPAGVTLSPDGTISGIPTQALSYYSFRVIVTDAKGQQANTGAWGRVSP